MLSLVLLTVVSAGSAAPGCPWVCGVVICPAPTITYRVPGVVTPSSPAYRPAYVVPSGPVPIPAQGVPATPGLPVIPGGPTTPQLNPGPVNPVIPAPMPERIP